LTKGAWETARPSLTALAATLILIVCAEFPLAATTLARLNLNQLARAADAVARVRCTDAASYLDQGTVWTRTQFAVIDSLKGSTPSQITVRLPGGHAGHIFVSIEAVPRFRPGEEGILFLEQLPAGEYSVTAWALGTFRIRRNDRTGEETVTQDSSATAVFDPASRQFVTEGIRDLPLGEFRRRLATALRAPAAARSNP
jgi:hypothetical protein